MSDFLSLPLDIHILICRNLNLHDCLTYSQLSTTCHDAVYYVFAHRIQLDFSSVINSNHSLELSDDVFFKVLYAHTRATLIRNFCIQHNFAAFTELSPYFSLYWAHTFVPCYDETVADCSILCDTHVGHQRGQLIDVHYLESYGTLTPQQCVHMHTLLNTYDDVYGVHIIPEDNTLPLLLDNTNWSS